ncbi:MAG: hypothetical protein ACREJC_08360 [Tepidisphaeraceae bacterium]
MPILLRFRLASFALAIFVVGTVACADDDARRAQVAAASADAMATLASDISAAELTPGLTVGEFASRAGAADELTQIVRRARQVGGPRWIDDYTCQVKVEIDGQQVSRALVQIARDHRATAPLSSERISQLLESWKARSFAATGSSVGAEHAQELRPAALDGWTQVSNEARRQAVNAARASAVRHALDTIRPIRLSDTQSVGDAVDQEAVGKALLAWLNDRPVTQVQFGDDLKVSVTLGVSGSDLFDAFAVACRDAKYPLPDDASLVAARREFAVKATNPRGQAGAERGAATRVRPRAELPMAAPAWVSQSLDGEGVAPFTDTQLKTARAAERRAADVVRTKLLALPLTTAKSVAELAGEDAVVDRAVKTAVARARVYHVDYRADGSVSVKVVLDPHDFWDELAHP